MDHPPSDTTMKQAIEQLASARAGEPVICRSFVVIAELGGARERGLSVFTNLNMTPWLMDGMVDYAMNEIAMRRAMGDEPEEDTGEGDMNDG